MTKETAFIQQTVDKALDVSINHPGGLSAPIEWVPENMIDHTKPTGHNGIVFWKPIEAALTETELKAFEQEIGVTLPPTYKTFLSYRYFIELNFGHEAWFFRHTSNFRSDYRGYYSQIQADYPMILPFARETDRGFFCFDTSQAIADHEYQVVTYDPDWGIQPYRESTFTFFDLIQEMNERLDNWRNQLAKRI